MDVLVDQYTPPQKKKLSLKDYNKQRKNSGQGQKAEIIAKKIKPIVEDTSLVKENLTMCCICDIWDSRDAIRKHYLDHHFR